MNTGQEAEGLQEPAGIRKSLIARAWGGMCGAARGLFGILSLIVSLAAVSVIPVVNLVSLGYLLEVSGRIARTGRLRDGFIGIEKAARLGGIVLGTYLLWWPARIIAGLRDSAAIVDPEGGAGWNVALGIVTALTTLHFAWALLRGGKLRHFAWPAPIRFFRWLKTPGKFTRARDGVWDYVAGLRLPYYFWLGARGFAGTVLWLLIPVGILILAGNIPSNAAILPAFLGGLLLIPVLLYLPFMQTHFARENRFRSLFDFRAVRGLYGKAPFMFWLALVVTLALAVPLFLLKIELTPAEITWLPSLLFVSFGFPARLLTGWAMGLANKREAPRHFVFRWSFKLLALPVVFAYVIILYITQYLAWDGSMSLLEQHAFLLPTPF